MSFLTLGVITFENTTVEGCS